MNALELSKQLNSKLTDIFKEDDSDFIKKYFNEAKKKKKKLIRNHFSQWLMK